MISRCDVDSNRNLGWVDLDKMKLKIIKKLKEKEYNKRK